MGLWRQRCWRRPSPCGPGSRTQIAPEYETVTEAAFYQGKVYYRARDRLFCSDPADGWLEFLNGLECKALGQWRDGLLVLSQHRRPTAAEPEPTVFFLDAEGLIWSYGGLDPQFQHARSGWVTFSACDDRFCLLQQDPEAVFTCSIRK